MCWRLGFGLFCIENAEEKHLFHTFRVTLYSVSHSDQDRFFLDKIWLIQLASFFLGMADCFCLATAISIAVIW